MNRIDEILQNKGIMKSWLADKLKISHTLMSFYCNNTRQPSEERLKEIALILGVPYKDLLN